MATLTGEAGKVMFGSDSGSAGTQVAEVRSWTVEHTKDVIEDTAMGDAARTYLSGLHQFTGTLECMYDTAQTATAAIFDPASDSQIEVEFFPAATTGVKYIGKAIITSVSRTASFDDLITATVSIQGSGPLQEVDV